MAGGSCRGEGGALPLPPPVRPTPPPPPPPPTPPPPPPPPTPPARDSSIWHDVECGAYAADLKLWEELADGTDGPILDLGCGTGRVALHLASRGHSIAGLDTDAELVAAFNERAAELPTHAVAGDAREFTLEGEAMLVLVPMQLVQLFASAGDRIRCLRCIERHLRPGGLAALAIVESMPAVVDASLPLPDGGEMDGWVYSSLPLEPIVAEDSIVVRRLRQTVSPDGELSDELNELELRMLSADELEREAAEAGLRPAGRRSIPPTEAHVGSTVVLLEKGS
jgi:SAM-dependent methyltransferase